jgi:hypothetical protein
MKMQPLAHGSLRIVGARGRQMLNFRRKFGRIDQLVP